MPKYLKTCIVTLATMPLLLCSCATNQKKIELYYSIPTISYLRECPNYNCQVVTEIYNAGKVKVITKNHSGWWQVESVKNRKTGWIQKDLLSDIPIIPKNYYVAVESLPLRDGPSQDIVSRKTLNFGDEVRKLAEKDGWWQVLAKKDKAIGWVPAKMVAKSKPEHPESPPQAVEAAPESPGPSKNAYYYVASENVKLHLIPDNSSQVVKDLKLNDQVEKLSQSGTAWIKVRYLGTGAEGWAASRYFKDAPITKKNQIVTEKKRVRRVSTPRRKAPRTPESGPVELEGM